MNALTVTTKGQLTLRKELLRHMGVQAGEKVEVAVLPGGKIEIQALRKTGSIADVYGLLRGKTRKKATLEEIDAAAAAGWAGLTE